jgi:hypothetical protein
MAGADDGTIFQYDAATGMLTYRAPVACFRKPRQPWRSVP